MEDEKEIPCSACRLWDQATKRFSCDPNNCERLSRWLLKHARDATVEEPIETIQYVV